MTDNFLLHNSAAAEKYWNLQECPSSEESSLMNGCEERLQQLSQRIAGKQNGIRKIEEAIIVLGILKSVCVGLCPFCPGPKTANCRENQIYNALSYYLYGDEREAVVLLGLPDESRWVDCPFETRRQNSQSYGSAALDV